MKRLKARVAMFVEWDAFAEPWIPLGYPELVAIDQSHVLVSTWARRAFVLDLVGQQTLPQPETGESSFVGRTLASPAVARTSSSTLCAVASRAGWASAWRIHDSSTMTIYPVGRGQVGAVALTPSGDRLLMGLGFYALNPEWRPKASVESWQIESTPSHRASQRLPGIVVERLALSPQGDILAAVTGVRSQQRLHVSVLEQDSLRILDTEELDQPASSILAMAVNPRLKRLILAFRDRIEERVLSDLHTIRRCVPLESASTAAAISRDGNSVLMSSGTVVDLSADKSAAVFGFADCLAVEIVGEGSFVGIAPDGRVRSWTEAAG